MWNGHVKRHFVKKLPLFYTLIVTLNTVLTGSVWSSLNQKRNQNCFAALLNPLVEGNENSIENLYYFSELVLKTATNWKMSSLFPSFRLLYFSILGLKICIAQPHNIPLLIATHSLVMLLPLTQCSPYSGNPVKHHHYASLKHQSNMSSN